MIDGWRFNKNFRRHQKAMDFFRLSHIKMPENTTARPSEDLPVRFIANTAGLAGTADHFTDEKGRVIVVPIWDIELPAGTQN